MLDAILCEDWANRSFSFNATWGESSEMASARDGSGDDVFVLFRDDQCVYEQFLHELHPRRPLAEVLALADQVPATRPPLVAEFLSEPAFMAENVSQFGWYDPAAQQWVDIQPTPVPQEYSLLDRMVAGSADASIEWASECYEMQLPDAAVIAIFERVPLTPALALSLNPDADLDTVLSDAEEIGSLVLA